MKRHERIEEHYLGILRKEGRGPESVGRLCEELEISEREFFEVYPNLQAVERRFWSSRVEEIVRNLEDGDEFQGFSARERLLAFYFAFLDHSLNYRSLLLLRVNRPPAVPHPSLKGLTDRFEEFADGLIRHGIESGELPERGPVSRFYGKGFVLNFLTVNHFYLHDESEGYERTDAFVEKSVALLFDLVGRQALDRALDLGRFLLPKQLQRG